MEEKREGIAFRPLYVPGKQRSTNRVHPLRLTEGPPCEMCGSRVVATTGTRVCTRCGFLTGSEGI